MDNQVTGRVLKRVVRSALRLTAPELGNEVIFDVELECGHHTTSWTAGPEARCIQCEPLPKPSREEEAMERQAGLLAVSLSFAVPMHAQWFIDNGWSLERVIAAGQEVASIIASQGSNLMWRTKAKEGGYYDAERKYAKPHDYGTAGVFNALARGIAAASFAPGGLTAFGMHFENDASLLRRAA